MAIKVRELLELIPDDVLEEIGEDLKVDYVYQKLTGLKMFKVLLYSLAETTRISLRSMERAYSYLFANRETTRHSSLADRLARIKPDFFKAIFEHLISTYQDRFSSKHKNIYRFDSTLMGLSVNLLGKIGLNCGAGEMVRYFKVTVGQKGLIPASVRFCTEESEVSEDVALKQAILEATIASDDIVLFDRGLSGVKNLSALDAADIKFVTRVRVDRRHKVLETFPIELLDQSTATTPTDSSATIILSDQKILLLNKGKAFFKTKFRLVKICSEKTGEELWFLTNIFTLSANDVAELYRRRWDIEVFFRFIKQELNLKHFLALNLNGMKVYVYMILIFAILLLIYKTQNNLTGYKFVKLAFFRELEIEITADIVERYGGDRNQYLQDWGLV